MKERRSRALKVHFQHNGNHRTLCGNDGRATFVVNNTTCRMCMFHYLAESASWARRFLDDLRGKPAGRPRGRDRVEMSIPLTDEQGERMRAELRRVLGPAALGEFGPLTPQQEADMVTFGEYVRRTREEFAPIGSLAELQAQAQEYMAPLPRVALTSLGGELAGAGQGHAVTVPAGATAPVDGKVKGLGDGFARAFGQQCSPEKAVSYFLPFQSTGRATVQPVVEGGGPATDAIGVKPGQVTEQAGDAGQVGDKAGGDFQAPE